MAKSDYSIIDFYNLVSGLNTVSSAIRLKTDEARDVQDMDYAPIGGITKRNGYDALNDIAVSASACTGLFMARYSTAGGTNLAYLVSGTKLWSMAAALGGTWTDATNGLTITAGNNNIWNFAILNNTAVAGNGDTDASFKINSAGVATALTPGPFTKFLFPVEARGYMWYFVPTVAATIEYDRCYFSNINDPGTVGANNYIDVAKGQGGDVRGAVEYKTYLYIFKLHGIYQVNYQPTRVNSAGTIFPWNETPNPIVPGVGTASHRSIVKFTTPTTHTTPGQELVFFIDQNGVPRIFDGSSTMSFASKIGSSRDNSILSLSNMDRTRSRYAHAVNYPDKNRIIFWLSQTNSKQDRPWVLDYTTGFAISRYKYFLPFNCSALFEKSDGTFKPYAGDYAGQVHQLDQGSTDNGQPIDDYYVTGDTFNKSPMLRSKWRFLEMRGANGSTTQATKISYYINGEDTPVSMDTKTMAKSQTQWSLGSNHAMVWGAGTQWAKRGLTTVTSEIGLESKTLRTRIESEDKTNDSLTLEGWSLAADTLGTSQE